uniref:Uncharacterized protein n=1 Tax=Setaria viridis TaxID=4556 RepID=A0A4U6V0H4_SETVI|nr:hypothetical protein SEVIR_4G235400v2 [Setaria viridis]
MAEQWPEMGERRGGATAEDGEAAAGDGGRAVETERRARRGGGLRRGREENRWDFPQSDGRLDFTPYCFVRCGGRNRFVHCESSSIYYLSFFSQMFQGALRLTNLQAHENKKKLQARENQYFLVFVQNISKHDIKRMKREISDRTKKIWKGTDLM